MVRRRRSRLLELPVQQGVARIASGYLDAAADALGRLSDPKDRESLHDFRVAVRRLRSTLRAYRRWLGSAVRKKDRRRLRELGQATNLGRDAEVQIAWLEAQREMLRRRERAGLNWLLRRLRQVKREAYRKARKRVRQDFHRAAEALRPRLEAAEQDDTTLRQAFGTLLREHAEDLETRLAAIETADDEEPAHDARISAKRLRYLFEPVATELDGGKKITKQLKRLQDVLGELHDRHVLAQTIATDLAQVATDKAQRMHTLAVEGDAAELARAQRRDESLGLVALAGAVRRSRDELFAALEGEWLGAQARRFTSPLVALSDQLSGRIPVRREIERKYLLSGVPPSAKQAASIEIQQGWLPGGELRERLRRTVEKGKERWYRTVKLGLGLERTEIEEAASRKVFETMWPLTEGCRVTKQRYRVREGDLTWEVDEFTDRELVLAEVELPATTTEVPIPSWLEPHLVREVTGEAEYTNLNLAK